VNIWLIHDITTTISIGKDEHLYLSRLIKSHFMFTSLGHNSHRHFACLNDFPKSRKFHTGTKCQTDCVLIFIFSCVFIYINNNQHYLYPHTLNFCFLFYHLVTNNAGSLELVPTVFFFAAFTSLWNVVGTLLTSNSLVRFHHPWIFGNNFTTLVFG